MQITPKLGSLFHAKSQQYPALEAWVLVASRSIPEQIRQSLMMKGEKEGLPVLIVEWEREGLASLAALCASAPDLVGSLVSADAAIHAEVLAEIAGPQIESIRRDMESWNLGFEMLRAASLSRFQEMLGSPRTAQSKFGQDVALNDRSERVERKQAKDAFDRWWTCTAPTDSPLVVAGLEGVGKTWAALDWLQDRNAFGTILLAVPSSATSDLSTVDENKVKHFLGERLYELARCRNPDHWLCRVNLLLQRPADEGPLVTLLLDGINQEPSVNWLALLQTLQAPAFAGKIRVIVTTRPHFLESRLHHLRGLIVQGTLVAIENYDLEPGGEFDRMLAFKGLSREALHPDLIELARNPRLFSLVIRLRERLVDAGAVTIHRLLWEYGRDSFGERTNRSFSESEWREWLAEIARRWRNGDAPRTTRDLGTTVARPDLSPDDVAARLSDIIDGRFAGPNPASRIELSPSVVAHALGAALLDEFSAQPDIAPEILTTELDRWLDPISGLDQRAEILRAAVSIGLERDIPATQAVLGVIVTAWLQTQNVTDAHRQELQNLAGVLVDPLLDAVEKSNSGSHRSARLWAVNALRSIQKDDSDALAKIVARSAMWFRTVSRGIGYIKDEHFEQNRRQRMIERIGCDEAKKEPARGIWTER